jgi:hypothetical protein
VCHGWHLYVSGRRRLDLLGRNCAECKLLFGALRTSIFQGRTVWGDGTSLSQVWPNAKDFKSVGYNGSKVMSL